VRVDEGLRTETLARGEAMVDIARFCVKLVTEFGVDICVSMCMCGRSERWRCEA
jgi:hypothetical protein